MIYQKIIHHKNNLPESGTDNDIGFFSPKMEMTMILTQNGDDNDSHPKWRDEVEGGKDLLDVLKILLSFIFNFSF